MIRLDAVLAFVVVVLLTTGAYLAAIGEASASIEVAELAVLAIAAYFALRGNLEAHRCRMILESDHRKRMAAAKALYGDQLEPPIEKPEGGGFGWDR